MSEFVNYEAIRREMWKKYPYKVVAIYKGKLIASGETYLEVLREASRKIGNKRFMLHRVGPPRDSIAIL